MKTTRRISLIIGSLFICSLMYAQEQILNFGLHNYNPMIFNPALTGWNVKHQAILQGRYQPSDYTNYVTLGGSYDNYFDKIKSGFGINSFYDKSGAITTAKLGLSYAFNLKFDEKNALRIGVGFLINTIALDGSQIRLSDGTSPNVYNSLNGIYPEFNMGLYYSHSNFGIGVAAFNLLNSYISFVPHYQSLNISKRYFTLYANYKFTLSEKIQYSPQLLAYYNANEGYYNWTENGFGYLRLELYNKFTFYKRFFVSPNLYSFNYNNSNSIGISLQAGVSFAKYFEIIAMLFQYQFPGFNQNYSSIYKPLTNFELMVKFKMQ